MLLPEDDYPLHQSVLPLAHVMNGHPNAYDRFFFNGFDESFYFAVALGLYPNRGVIDGAFSVVIGDRQYSVFASEALAGRPTSVGPIRVEIVEPLRVNRVSIDAPEQGLRAELLYRQLTATIEEPRQTMHDEERLFMDVTRATQLGTWSGWVETPEGRRELRDLTGTKDRSWGVRPLGEPLPGAPSKRAAQLCFFWAPLRLGDEGVHYMTFRDSNGDVLSESVGRLPRAGSGDADHVGGDLELEWQDGTRWAASATLRVAQETFTLTPLLRFHMRGVGYAHPTFAHGRWHGGAVVDGETIVISEVAPDDYFSVHVQQVVHVQGDRRRGIGVLEQLVVGPYQPAGLAGLLDGYGSPA